MNVIKIQGSDEQTMQVARVPCVGERIRTSGRSRLVTAVEHLPIPWGPWMSLPYGGPVTITWHPQTPTATVTVADE